VAQNLVKQSQQRRDKTDVLMREAEVAFDEDRNAPWRSLKDSGGA